MQLTAHEFKHGFQYLKGETDFSQNGLGGGPLYDLTDEKAAIERENLFGPIHNVKSELRNHPNLPRGTISFKLLTPEAKSKYNVWKKQGIVH